MTKLQALFVLWLRHEEFCGGSWRWVAGKYYNRYKYKQPFKDEPTNGNQIDGIELEEAAFNVLYKDVDPMIVGYSDLYDNDLTYIDANLKRHLK